MVEGILRFKGKDGSMGLVKGEIYKVKVYMFGNYLYVDWTFSKCPYSSVSKMLENWEFVNVR